ncbi:hypothetical protein QBC45DRAFT_452564 [Copromyces sp. CBS 386.78]|nr:hypothetical protein QBC45DRAFT_452564 [Copromyces sp. CBS 386.78]
MSQRLYNIEKQSRPILLQQIPADTETSAGVQSPKQNLYSYVPMLRGYIRLLQLLPPENEDTTIRCKLFCTALDLKGIRPYVALSYVWGSKDKPSKIYAKVNYVIIWLREEVAGSDRAFEEIRIVAELSIRRLDNNAGILILLQRPSTEVDGSAFCLGLNILNLSNKLGVDLQARILSVTYLIQGAIFWPKYVYADNFSLNIRPLATNRRDKVYTLFGISSNNLIAIGLFADYKISLSDDKEITIIEGKGYILSEVLRPTILRLYNNY